MLQFQKLPNSLLSATQLLNVYEEIKYLAKANNLTPLTSRDHYLFQRET